MKRYNSSIFFPHAAKAMYNVFALGLYGVKRIYTNHAIEQICDRIPDSKQHIIYEYTTRKIVSFDNMFEFYESNGVIVKACFRVRWSSTVDCVFVISKENTIITFYLINNCDTHNTLNKELYNTED